MKQKESGQLVIINIEFGYGDGVIGFTAGLFGLGFACYLNV